MDQLHLPHPPPEHHCRGVLLTMGAVPVVASESPFLCVAERQASFLIR